MITYMIKRLLLIIPMLFLILLVTFVISTFMSQNARLNQMEGLVEWEYILAERERMGYYDPWYVKLGKYFDNFFRGDWGTSYIVASGMPVTTLIAKIFPKTIELVILPIILIPILSVKLGVTSAKNRNNWKDTIVRGIMMLGVCIPVFWLATLVQYFVGTSLFNFTYGTFNLDITSPNSISMRYPNSAWPFSTGFRLIDAFLFNDQVLLQDTIIHMVLPALCMTIIALAGITRQTRASMLDVMQKDYVRTARAKGVSETDVINKHSLRNALIPTSTAIVANTAALLTGSLFVEMSFNYTGMGYFMVSAIRLGDYVVVNGILVFNAIIILSGTLAADILYTIIDPRIVYT